MAKKVKVETVGAIVDGKPLGSTIEVSEETAKRLESLKYVRIIEEVKPVKKSTSATKKPPRTSSKKKTEATKDTESK